MQFATGGPSLFWLAFRTAILTILTLGIYRFWMTTNLRRYYWGQVRIQGDPLEYTGTGLEKLLGFFFAVIVLAVYLGVINLGLTFIGLSFFQGNPFALQLSLIAALPLYYYAAYRAYGYFLARTRWRGIRFGLAPGAWGYAGRAILWTLAALVTGGLLYPMMQFKLAKYITDRSSFGDQKFEQGGTWTGLFGAWIWIYLAGLGFGGVIALGVRGGEEAALPVAIAAAVLYLAIFVVLIRYGTAAFRYLWRNRTLGGAAFACDINPWAVVVTTIFGALGALLAVLGIVLVLGAAAGVAAWFGLGPDLMAELAQGFDPNGEGINPQGQIATLISVIVGYILIIALFVPFLQVLVTRPIARRQVGSIALADPSVLARARQRAHDKAAEAGGFADALGVDAGAGF